MIITDLIIIICLMLSAFFSGMEIAFVSSNKIYLEIEKQQSGINARLLSFITKNPSRFIATMLVGNNISLVIYGIFIGDRILQMMFPSTVSSTGKLTMFKLLTGVSLILLKIFKPLVIKLL